MIQPLRGRIRPVGYFLRGATQFAAPRTIAAIARFVMGILFAAFERSVAGIRDAVADSPTASALRQFLGSRELRKKLVTLLRWKTRQNLRKALRRPGNRSGSIILAIDSTCKGTLSRRARHLFFLGHGERVGQHIFVCGLLLFPDGTRLPLGPLQKKGGRHAPTQVDLAAVLVRELAPELRRRSVVVVADAFFFAKKFLRAIQAAGFHYVIACKGNTVLTDRTPLESLVRTLRLTASCVTLPARRGERQKTFSVARRLLCLRCGGTQAVVFSRPHNKRSARTKFLVSDLQDAPASELVRLYAHRWQIEVYFREAKSYLGFDQYRVTGEYGPGNFALLVTLAYQFLHWHGAEPERAQTTLARLRALTADVAADNYEVLERAIATRHRRKKFRERFHPQAPSSAHDSHKAKTRVKRVRLAS